MKTRASLRVISEKHGSKSRRGGRSCGAPKEAHAPLDVCPSICFRYEPSAADCAQPRHSACAKLLAISEVDAAKCEVVSAKLELGSARQAMLEQRVEAFGGGSSKAAMRAARLLSHSARALGCATTSACVARGAVLTVARRQEFASNSGSAGEISSSLAEAAAPSAFHDCNSCGCVSHNATLMCEWQTMTVVGL